MGVVVGLEDPLMCWGFGLADAITSEMAKLVPRANYGVTDFAAREPDSFVMCY